jgi:hypothetical protein
MQYLRTHGLRLLSNAQPNQNTKVQQETGNTLASGKDFHEA